jgi:hypothetical protein
MKDLVAQLKAGTLSKQVPTECNLTDEDFIQLKLSHCDYLNQELKNAVISLAEEVASFKEQQNG